MFAQKAIRLWCTHRDRWLWLIATAGVALLALRISLERTPQRPLWGAVVGVACLLTGYLLRSSSRSLAPLCLAWLYVVWPVASPAMAASVTFVALVALVAYNLDEQRCAPTLVDGAVYIAALALYVATLAPTILPADSGEFQIAGPLLGVAHPPGFPLFTVLAKLFSLLPFGEVAWRVNLMGGVTGALSLLVVGRTARRLARSTWAGIVAAGALGFSTTFWAQSTTVNIRALTILFTALCCSCLERFLAALPASKRGVRALTGLALSYGLLIAHHAWPVFFAPVFAIVVLWHDPRVMGRFREWPRYLIAFLLPFTANLYIVLRAITGAPFGTEELVNPGRVLDHLLGRGFGGDMFAFLRLDRVLWERFLVVGNILTFQFGALLLALSALGFAWLAWRRKKVAFLLGGVFATMAFIVATYRAPQSVEYLMPAYVPVALAIGCTVPFVSVLSPARLGRSLLLALVLLPVAALGWAHLPSYVALHHDRSAREYAESVLLSAPPNAHILSNWHWYTPLRYLQLIEGQRLDVEVTYLYPQGATTMPQAWPQRIERELAQSDRPLIVTNHYPTYLDLPYRFVPHGEAFIVQVEPTTEVPTDLTRLDADLTAGEDQIRVLGYRIDRPAEVRPGDWVTVDLVWQPLVPLQRPYALFVQLIGPSGVPMGQRDRRHDAAPTYQLGEVLTDRYRFPVYLSAPPGAYQLIAGTYHTYADGTWERLKLSDGSDAIALESFVISAAAAPPVTAHRAYQPFAQGPTLVGVDYDDTLPAQRRVYLHWRAGPLEARVELHRAGQLAAAGTVAPSPERGYVTTILDVPPGTDGLQLVLRSAHASTQLHRRVGWGLSCGSPASLPAPRQRQHYVPFGGELVLTGVRTAAEWHAGETQRVELGYVGLRPILRDYVVSLSVRGDEITGGPSDSVPALGAIPTLKWIRGSEVNDAHLLPVRSDAAGRGQLMLGIYDAFTSEGLPPQDERLERLGLAGVPLQQVTVP